MVLVVWVALRNRRSKNHPGWTGALLVLPGIISPIALGLFLGKMDQQDLLRAWLGCYGFRTIHQVPSAWDFKFGRIVPCWLIVTLKDGSRVYGRFDTGSFASDDPKERDIFIEAIYVPRDDGEWLPVEGSAGILIRAEQVAAIEFVRME